MCKDRGSLPILEVISVYDDLPVPRCDDVIVKFWDSYTVANMFVAIRDYKAGKYTDPFLKLTLTDEDKGKLESQGISIEGLLYLLFDLENGKTCTEADYQRQREAFLGGGCV